jgi:hypothetical protein
MTGKRSTTGTQFAPLPAGAFRKEHTHGKKNVSTIGQKHGQKAFSQRGIGPSVARRSL